MNDDDQNTVRPPRVEKDMAEQSGQKPTLDYARPERAADPRYPVVLPVILVVAGAAVAVVPFFEANASAKVNFWTVAFALVVCGLVVRFQHVLL